jgi:hypothetical protein
MRTTTWAVLCTDAAPLRVNPDLARFLPSWVRKSQGTSRKGVNPLRSRALKPDGRSEEERQHPLITCSGFPKLTRIPPIDPAALPSLPRFFTPRDQHYLYYYVCTRMIACRQANHAFSFPCSACLPRFAWRRQAGERPGGRSAPPNDAERPTIGFRRFFSASALASALSSWLRLRCAA